MVAEGQLREASEAFFDAFASDTPPLKLLSYFSTTSPVTIQHAPAECPIPQASRLVGPNALRSYFDLLSTHFLRGPVHAQAPPQVDPIARQVTLAASTTWTWRKSGRAWTEDFIWTLEYDEGLKIVSFVIRTVSGPGTCVMRAVDTDPLMRGCSNGNDTTRKAFVGVLSSHLSLSPRRLRCASD
ncbi:unnamed protein product [Cyclocybe aegerita]|uniref:Uncharacterized protein n=1 Tax=Cyclocybe aegerita TaxID=1973307 RepID=A0A8S0VUW7_CYCAE|nr:unnamed protein product [Cyclocybe aegerita]